MTNKEGEELYKRTLSELRDTIISLPEICWVREVFCDYTEGYPGKEYIKVYEMTVREFDMRDGYHMSQLQRYLLHGWRKLDPIEYTDGGPKDVPTYYKPYKENQFYLAFILDYNPNPYSPKYYYQGRRPRYNDDLFETIVDVCTRSMVSMRDLQENNLISEDSNDIISEESRIKVRKEIKKLYGIEGN